MGESLNESVANEDVGFLDEFCVKGVSYRV